MNGDGAARPPLKTAFHTTVSGREHGYGGKWTGKRGNVHYGRS